jgi:pyruvate/2-oxoglutarate dehydrogenase complex dihydrolipoamide acyltransferase (E2) component
MVEASDKARQVAEENGLTERDMNDIDGSGEEGRVLVSDVREFVEAATRIEEQVEVTRWAGKKNYECNVCEFKTIERGRMIDHLNDCYPKEGLQ